MQEDMERRGSEETGWERIKNNQVEKEDEVKETKKEVKEIRQIGMER